MGRALCVQNAGEDPPVVVRLNGTEHRAGRARQTRPARRTLRPSSLPDG